MNIRITPGLLSGKTRAIPSKSQAHRMLICAAFAQAPTRLVCSQTNRDIQATAQCLTALGADIHRTGDGYEIHPARSIPAQEPTHPQATWPSPPIVTFSPLNDERIPECGGLIFGGGFPEIFAARLAANKSMKESIARAAADGMPIYAECGGFMYLTREIKDFEGAAHEMCGIIPMS